MDDLGAVKRSLGVPGIAVAGMPLGSPGMESSLGAEPYTVFSFTAEGAYRTFRRIEV